MSKAIDTTPAGGQSAPGWKPFVVVAVGAVACLLLFYHVRGINGPGFWPWRWRDLDPAPLLGSMSLAAVPFFLGQFLLTRRSPERFTSVVLILAMISWMALAFAACFNQVQPPGSRALYLTVTDNNANGYLFDADMYATLRDDGKINLTTFMTHFPEIMPKLRLHGRSRPPGIVFFYLIFRNHIADGWWAVMLSTVVLGLFASLSIPATYWFVRALSGSAQAGLAGACFLALSPGFVSFFPTPDIVYPAWMVLLTLTWLRSMRPGGAIYAAGFGLLLAGICFVTFNLLVLGIFLGAMTLLHLRQDGKWAPASQWQRAGVNIALAGAGFAAFWIVLQLATGFDIIAVFKVALKEQAKFDALAKRPFPASIPWDLSDFFLGSGWISAALLAMSFAAWRARRCVAVVAVCLGQLALVAGTGLLQTETARVWLFMQPLLLLPVGLELARWSPRQRIAVYLTLLAVTMATAQNLWLLGWTNAQYP